MDGVNNAQCHFSQCYISSDFKVFIANGFWVEQRTLSPFVNRAFHTTFATHISLVIFNVIKHN
jgi:hypothetical protein